MNALWISRMAAYQLLPERLESAKRLIALKIERKNVLLRRYKKKSAITDMNGLQSIQDLLLLEARAGKQFWREWLDRVYPGAIIRAEESGSLRSDEKKRLRFRTVVLVFLTLRIPWDG